MKTTPKLEGLWGTHHEKARFISKEAHLKGISHIQLVEKELRKLKSQKLYLDCVSTQNVVELLDNYGNIAILIVVS